MTKTTIAALIVLGFTLPAAAAPATPGENDCKTAWTKTDADKNGVVEGKEAAPYLAAIKKAGGKFDANNDGKLTQEEFMNACKAGTFVGIK